MYLKISVSYDVDGGYWLCLRIYSCRTQHGFLCIGKRAKILPIKESRHSSCCSFNCGTLCPFTNICSSFIFSLHLLLYLLLQYVVIVLAWYIIFLKFPPLSAPLSLLTSKWNCCLDHLKVHHVNLWEQHALHKHLHNCS